MTGDLSEKLSGLLSDPEAMKEIAALASQLGVDAPGVLSQEQTPSAEPQSSSGSQPSFDLQGLLQSLQTGTNALPAPQKETQQSDNMLSQLAPLLPMLGSLRQEDETTRLLEAMRPFLSDERQRKLDQAKRLIRVMKLMPLLKDLPLFDL